MVKTVLITGRSEGGIGDYLTQDFHKRGLRVFAAARDLKKIEHLKAKGLDVLRRDVTSLESLEAAVKDVADATGGALDFLANNSGGGLPPFHSTQFCL
jgi:1-acylglycerone phosphate reductase